MVGHPGDEVHEAQRPTNGGFEEGGRDGGGGGANAHPSQSQRQRDKAGPAKSRPEIPHRSLRSPVRVKSDRRRLGGERRRSRARARGAPDKLANGVNEPPDAWLSSRVLALVRAGHQLRQRRYLQLNEGGPIPARDRISVGPALRRPGTQLDPCPLKVAGHLHGFSLFDDLSMATHVQRD